ncbi:MAG: cbb3-type cytochrome c oxidase subunit I [Anaerolineae bacterium]|nr:cbb3-type cytochrome c oxidase subunit I [Anaerolineae bacterium]
MSNSIPTTEDKAGDQELSLWWRNGVILVMIFGFSVLIWLSIRAYRDGPPIPERVVDAAGATVFTGADVMDGQHVFLRYGLMENGTVWGHGAYLGPDFTAEYLHTLALDAQEAAAQQGYQRSWNNLTSTEQAKVSAQVQQALKENRYDPATHVLTFTAAEAASFQSQIQKWSDYFAAPTSSAGLPPKFISDPEELRQLTAFFAWSAWAANANRPGLPYSYTNNFPYDPAAGNTPPTAALVWSALSLIGLLGGTAVVLFAFGRFDYLGWHGKHEHVHPQMLPGVTTDSQKAMVKFFVLVALLFLMQLFVGAAVAHYRADPGAFYGIDLSRLLPSNIVRTWHLQLMVFWIATAFIAGALFLAPALAGKEPEGQVKWINLLFGALIVVTGGSLLGEILGINQLLGQLWFWLGHQGWEYLDLGRLWQVLLVIGLLIWLVLLSRNIAAARRNPEHREIASLFLYAAISIPLFYLPAMFFGRGSTFTVVDTWRFWIIHLWVEGFFELFATVMVALIFYLLGIVTRQTAARVVYLDAILYLGGGIIGTGHHWYWTGQANISLGLSAVFSALEVIPLTLLTLDAWDFIKLTREKCDICGQSVSIPHKWTFYFLMAVGFWNFVGAGVFGFLINLPIVSYYEVGTVLTPNHGHTAMMGVFGMLAIALLVFVLRQASSEAQWARTEKFVRVSFWGLNAGLALMVLTNLFPGGVLQLIDAVKNGYWHARSAAFLGVGMMKWIEWARLPADLIFIFLGVVPIAIAAGLTYLNMRKSKGDATYGLQPTPNA